MSVLKVYDSNGNKINIPSIKGEAGITFNSKSTEYINDTTMLFDDGTQISVGSVKAVGSDATEICDIGGGKKLLSCDIVLPESFDADAPLFESGFFSVSARTLQFVPDFADIYSSADVSATAGNYGFTNIKLLCISDGADCAPDGTLHYTVIGRWKE